MSTTLPIQKQNVLAYNNGEFIGYVVKTMGVGEWVKLFITTTWKPEFAKKKGQSVLRTAKVATIAYIDNTKTLYPKNEKFTFRMIPKEEA